MSDEKIIIKKNNKCDTRTCDYTKVSLKELRDNSIQHIMDVRSCMNFICDKLRGAGVNHTLKIQSLPLAPKII